MAIKRFLAFGQPFRLSTLYRFVSPVRIRRLQSKAGTRLVYRDNRYETKPSLFSKTKPRMGFEFASEFLSPNDLTKLCRTCDKVS